MFAKVGPPDVDHIANETQRYQRVFLRLMLKEKVKQAERVGEAGEVVLWHDRVRTREGWSGRNKNRPGRIARKCLRCPLLLRPQTPFLNYAQQLLDNRKRHLRFTLYRNGGR